MSSYEDVKNKHGKFRLFPPSNACNKNTNDRKYKKKAQGAKFLLFHLIIFQLFFSKLRMRSPHLVLEQVVRIPVTSNLSRNEVDVCRCLAIKVIVLLFKDGGRRFTSLGWNPPELSFLKPWIVICTRNCTVRNI